MAAWTNADVKLIAPELGGGSYDALIDQFIVIANRRIPTAFGARDVDAGAYLTAHLMFMAKAGPYAGGGAGAGPVIGQSVGGVSVQYANLLNTHSHILSAMPDLAMSRYGIQYAGLLVLAALGPQVL